MRDMRPSGGGCRAVVGVVGAGHLRGIVYASKHYRGDLRFRDLVEGRNIKLTRAEQAARAARCQRSAAWTTGMTCVLWCIDCASWKVQCS